MLINSAGYKILTSVDQYLELVNSSLPGECSWCLGVSRDARAPLRPSAAGHPLGTFGEGVGLGCGIPGDLLEGVGLEGASLRTFWKGWFWAVASLWTFKKGWFWGGASLWTFYKD